MEELDGALNKIIKWIQEEVFRRKWQIYRKKSSKFTENLLDNRSTLISFKPFLDDAECMRVGGRLTKAKIPEEQKHPIILPAKHHITMTLLREKHLRLLHCCPQQLLNSIRSKYWPLAGAREAWKVTCSCVPCFRYRPRIREHLMVDLPESRVNVLSRPFQTLRALIMLALYKSEKAEEKAEFIYRKGT